MAVDKEQPDANGSSGPVGDPSEEIDETGENAEEPTGHPDFDAPIDLSDQFREDLLQAGYELAMGQEHRGAEKYFGAALRKAERNNWIDMPAEYFKYVALFRQGKFDPALKRCLRILKIVRDTIPESEHMLDFFHVMEKQLLEIMRCSGWRRFGVFLHLLFPFLGLRYPGKKGKGILNALAIANLTFRKPYPVEYKMLQPYKNLFGEAPDNYDQAHQYGVAPPDEPRKPEKNVAGHFKID